MRPEPTFHRIGGLTIVNLTGESFDAEELIEALRNADYSHLPDLPRSAHNPDSDNA